MRARVKPLSIAVSLAVSGVVALSGISARAQTPAPANPALKSDEEKKKEEKAKAEQKVEAVVITGIRASLERSIDLKKDATGNIEAITAEDVGKMPDKNLADSLQRLAGVAVRTDYDEAEKVSIRGTNPDMSLILFNGHTVSGGDWYVADQGSSSRSTSLSLMPSSVLNQALVYKTSQANIADGGLAGTINVTTRKPLNERKAFGGVASVGGAHSDLPNKTAHNLNASLNWKNASNTIGVIGQAFAEKRFMRRDSVSRLAYGVNLGWGEIDITQMLGITDASLAGTGLRAADLNGVRMPGSLSSEFVESVRDRKGGMFSAQWRPTGALDVTLTGFYSEMGANNYGRLTSGANYSMLLGRGDPLGGTTANSSNGQRVYAQIRNPVIVNTVSNYGYPLRVLQSADIVFPNGTTPQYIGNSEGFYRDGAKATSGFFDIDGKYVFSDNFSVKALYSNTRGVGTTQLDQGATFARYGLGVSYNLGDLHEAPFVRYTGAGTNQPGLNADGSGYRFVSLGASSVKTVDKEQSLALDATWGLHSGMWSTLDFGFRHADHDRDLIRWAPSRRSPTLPTPPGTGYVNYPSDFGSGLGGGAWDNTGFYLTPEALRAFIATQFKPTSAEFERRVAGEIDMRERQTAAYAMQNFDNGPWSGNLGLRFVQTQVNANIVQPVPAGRCQRIEPGKPVVACTAYPGAIVTAGDGATYYDGAVWNPNTGTIYFKTPTDRKFNDVLPSLNLRYQFSKELIGRLGASKTIGRQNYNVLGAGLGAPTCNAQGCTVTGPNPNLKPLYAKNLDISLGWYFARRSLLMANVYTSNIEGYVKTGSNNTGETLELVDPTDPSGATLRSYTVVSSLQQTAKIQGVEVLFEMPIAYGFGMTSNASRARTRVADGRPMTGASDLSMNLGVYYEDDKLSARVVYNYRDKYVASTTAPAPTANSQSTSTILGVVQPTALTWAAPVANVALSLNYNFTKDLRVSFDATNLTNPARAQYRYSEAEQQKLDVSGRQYYLVMRYKF
ncbi:MAG: TonB-dependent receptor [Betaproteobacteria bacterium]|nr:TonB-dependent receptor [Betaproteobacteria bacterium]